MRDYVSGEWGFSLIWGLRASVYPRALLMAVPNAIIAFVLANYTKHLETTWSTTTVTAVGMIGLYTGSLTWLLQYRCNVAYDRWWEGGTLLQQVRGEWFNAYSSLIAFSSTDPKMEDTVERFHHMLARFMSLLFCCALQQVSPNRDKPFEIIDCTGIDPESLKFLHKTNDKVEVILQWIQRSTILNMQTGVLPIPPPVMSRAFQEISRGIVNLQNARKIADFPFPFPFAQIIMTMLSVYWFIFPVVASMLVPPYFAAAISFLVIFALWSVNFIALQLESPFGERDNDLPMNQMQSDWNKSIGTLLAQRAQRPPKFEFNSRVHQQLELVMSDGSTQRDNIEERSVFPSLWAKKAGPVGPKFLNAALMEGSEMRNSAMLNGAADLRSTPETTEKTTSAAAADPLAKQPAHGHGDINGLHQEDPLENESLNPLNVSDTSIEVRMDDIIMDNVALPTERLPEGGDADLVSAPHEGGDSASVGSALARQAYRRERPMASETGLIGPTVPVAAGIAGGVSGRGGAVGSTSLASSAHVDQPPQDVAAPQSSDSTRRQASVGSRERGVGVPSGNSKAHI